MRERRNQTQFFICQIAPFHEYDIYTRHFILHPFGHCLKYWPFQLNICATYYVDGPAPSSSLY